VRSAVKLLLAILGLLFPVVIYLGITSGNLLLVGCLMVFLVLARAISAGASKLMLTFITLGLAAVLWALETVNLSAEAFRFYPALMSFVIAGMFALSLKRQESLLESVAGKFTDVDAELNARPYLRALTGVWAGLILFNGCIAAWTALFASLEFWVTYNTFYAYVIFGCFGGFEWVYRQYYKARQRKNAVSGGEKAK
jgi:uncharacterized membrane protein